MTTRKQSLRMLLRPRFYLPRRPTAVFDPDLFLLRDLSTIASWRFPWR